MVIQQSSKGMAERELKANRPLIKTRLSLQSHWSRADRLWPTGSNMLQPLFILSPVSWGITKSAKSPHHICMTWEFCPTPYLFYTLDPVFPLFLLYTLTLRPPGTICSLLHFTCLSASFVEFLTIVKGSPPPSHTGPPGFQSSPSYNFIPLPPLTQSIYLSLPPCIPLSWLAGRPACLPTVWLHISSLLCAGWFPGNRKQAWQGSRAERAPCFAAARYSR